MMMDDDNDDEVCSLLRAECCGLPPVLQIHPTTEWITCSEGKHRMISSLLTKQGLSVGQAISGTPTMAGTFCTEVLHSKKLNRILSNY